MYADQPEIIRNVFNREWIDCVSVVVSCLEKQNHKNTPYPPLRHTPLSYTAQSVVFKV